MRAVITNAGGDTLYTDTGSQYYVNITHFSLAYVNGTERQLGLDINYLKAKTELVPNDGSGEVIYNVWQTPFSRNSDYTGVGGNLMASFDKYYRYEYDKNLDRNELHVFTEAKALSGINPAFDALCNGYVADIVLPGIEGPENSGINNTDPLTERTNQSTFKGIVLPPFNMVEAVANGYFAYNDGINPVAAADFFSSETFSNYQVDSGINKVYYAVTPKLFPIKAWYPIESSDTTNNNVDVLSSPVKIMNYEIAVPGYAANNSQNINDIYENSIGNFRFNRIGVYATKMNSSSAAPDNILGFVPDQTGFAGSEPVLFAIIELNENVDGKAKSNSILKDRSQGGAYEYSLDYQVNLGITSNPQFINGDKFYQESYRSQATTQFLHDMERGAIFAEAIMQLQFQMLELMHTRQVGSLVSLSDMAGNGNPSPTSGPSTGSLLPTIYGPWTENTGADTSWLAVYGTYMEGSNAVSKWKKALLVNTNFNVLPLASLGFLEDPAAYNTETLGTLVNNLAITLANMGIVSR